MQPTAGKEAGLLQSTMRLCRRQRKLFCHIPRKTPGLAWQAPQAAVIVAESCCHAHAPGIQATRSPD